MTRLLLEIGSEEIPARMQAAAAAQLAKRFAQACAAAGLTHGAITADATPRRLWLAVEDMAPASASTSEELKGPRADAPPQAIEGFLRKTGLRRDQLETRDTPKGAMLFAVQNKPGRPASEILGTIIPEIIRAFDWPKSMRWGTASTTTESPRWVRPLTHIVALLGDAVVPAQVHGLATGRTTTGHRIHAPGPLEITSANTYEAQLRAAHVIAASAERRALIERRATTLATAAGLALIPDEGLLTENAGLTEWPVPLLGRFDPAFLTVPREVIQLTMRTNQKYFALTDSAGQLAPAFICVANLEATDAGQAITQGNERVLSARLSDAKFFWDQDLATVREGGLRAFLPKLGPIVFHDRIGSIADKVTRLYEISRWLGHKLFPELPIDMFGEAAILAKADLVSATVAEFPEVQGLVGGYLARESGLDMRVADAIRDHYKPLGQGDDVPTAPVSIVVSLADKLDNLFQFFAHEMMPTGSRDPYALRRAGLGVIQIILVNSLRVPIVDVFAIATERNLLPHVDAGEYQSSLRKAFLGQPSELIDGLHLVLLFDTLMKVSDFFADRLKVQQREAGIRPDIIDAVFALGGEDDLVRLLARVHALQAFITTEDGTNLLAGYKRAANILKAEDAKDGPHTAQALDRTTLEHPAEHALAQALDQALPRAASAIEAEDFTAAMAALAALRAPVDRFFTDLMVNAPVPATRQNRLALLAAFRDAVQTVADFSRIEA